MSTPDGGLVGDATIRIRADTDPALRTLQNFTRDAGNRVGSSLGSVGASLTGALSSLARIGAVAGSVVPLVAGIATSVANIAPAAAGAATAFLAIRQASAVVQLGMVGVQDAISAAFKTGEGSAEEFQESLEKLSPAARDFVLAASEMRDEFTAFQQSIQEELFTGLDDVLRNTAESVLPVLQENFLDTASILRDMGTAAANTATDLAENGTLGQALSGANRGLQSLSSLPAQLIQGFTQIAAAGAPAFQSLTQSISSVADRISVRLNESFESGRLQGFVEDAVAVLGTLADTATGVFNILRNVFGGLSEGGADLFGVLGTVVSVLEEFTGAQAFQEVIQGLAETMSSLASTAAPLLLSLLEAILPVFDNLIGPVQILIEALGSALAPIIEALGPVLDAASSAIGELVEAVAPLFPIFGQLIAQLGPILTPILEFIGQIFQMLAPVVTRLATTIADTLGPILAVLPSILQPILDAFLQLLEAVLPLLNELITALTPVLDELSGSFIDLLIALAPVITDLLLLNTDILVALTPILIPLIQLVGRFASVLSGQLSNTLNNVVIPALNAVSAFLRGDFSRAFSLVGNAITGFIDSTIGQFVRMPGRVFNALSSLGSRLTDRMRTATSGMRDAASNGIERVLNTIRALPDKAAGALFGIGSALYNSGRALIQGFINGVQSLAQSLINTVSDLVSNVTDFFPGSPAKKGPLSGQGYTFTRGQHLTEDFAKGIIDQQRAVKIASQEVATEASLGVSPRTNIKTLPLMALPGAQGTASAIPVTINLKVVNQGVLGSRAEVLEWLTRALDELRRQRRLPIGNGSL